MVVHHSTTGEKNRLFSLVCTERNLPISDVHCKMLYVFSQSNWDNGCDQFFVSSLSFLERVLTWLLYHPLPHSYKTSDGRYMSVGAIEPQFYRLAQSTARELA